MIGSEQDRSFDVQERWFVDMDLLKEETQRCPCIDLDQFVKHAAKVGKRNEVRGTRRMRNRKRKSTRRTTGTQKHRVTQLEGVAVHLRCISFNNLQQLHLIIHQQFADDLQCILAAVWFGNEFHSFMIGKDHIEIAGRSSEEDDGY